MRLVTLGCAGVLVVAAAYDLLREWGVERGDGSVQTIARASEQGAPLPHTDSVEMSGVQFESPRAMVYEALAIARLATPGSPGAAAQRERARGLIADALAARPEWGEGLVVSAYLTSQNPRETASALDDLTRSYVGAPYLLEAGFWRIDYALRHWAAIGPVTQARVIDEAVWLTSVKQDRYEMIFERFRHSPAYVALLSRWQASRGADANSD